MDELAVYDQTILASIPVYKRTLLHVALGSWICAFTGRTT